MPNPTVPLKTLLTIHTPDGRRIRLHPCRADLFSAVEAGFNGDILRQGVPINSCRPAEMAPQSLLLEKFIILLGIIRLVHFIYSATPSNTVS